MNFHPEIINRYKKILLSIADHIEREENPGTSYEHLLWMLWQLEHESMDVGKSNRWLGFIQGILIERGHTTVSVERDFTRSYFSSTTFKLVDTGPEKGSVGLNNE